MSWIRINTTLPTDPKIIHLAAEIKRKRHEALGLAVEYFCWLDANFSDGFTSLTPKQINELFAQKNFAEALIKIGWASLDDKGCFFVQEFDSYNGKSAKNRAQNTEKIRKKRERAQKNVPHEQGTKTEQMYPVDGVQNGVLDKNKIYIDDISSYESISSIDPQKQTKAPHPETADAVLTYIASLANCGLVGQELTTCAQTFFDRSEAVGWTINGQPIRDWRAAARAYLTKWQGNNASRQAATTSPTMNKPKITYRSQTQQNYELR